MSLLLLGLVFGNVCTAQNSTAESGPIRCYTNEMEAERRRANPGMQSMDDFENWMREELKKAPQFTNRATRVIPTVVHVIYSNATENISTAQVQSQIDVLNEDFQRLNADTTNTPAGFLPAACNTDIEFCLATLDPNGNPTDGIDRVSMSGSPFSTGFVDNTIKPSTIWNPSNYFNLWVVNVSGGVLGWAQFPEAASLPGIGTGNGGANTDGVVCLYTSVGRPPANPFPGPYNLGRTATHEVGHWLGLRHIWGDGGCSVDDFCTDTPNSDAPNFGCPTTHVSCTTTDMVQNYMDYTDDDCMNIFTLDQKARMDVVLGSSVRRASLLSSSVCNLSPTIHFATATTTLTENSSSGISGCRGYQDLNITLAIGGPPTGNANVAMGIVSGTLQQGVDYDIIVGNVVFPSGATNSQNFVLRIYDDGALESAENLTINFTISGVTDATATAPLQHTITLNDNDFDPALGNLSVLLNEDFESPVTGWSVQNGGGTNQWVVAMANGAMNGNGSCYVSRNGGSSNSYSTFNASFSRLRSPLINATGISNMTLSFAWHCFGQQTAGTNIDFGSLSYSFDGTNFTTLVGTAASTPFVNSSTNTTFSMALPAVLENTNFYLGWEWTNDAATRNNPPFAIDDVLLQAQVPVLVETNLSSLDDQYLGPNSTVYWYDNTSGELLVRIDNPSAWDYGCTSVQVDRAGTGATVYQSTNMLYAHTDKTYLITPSNNNPTGNYTIRLYYTDAEISGWETATSQPRANILVAKTGGPISNITPATPLANGPTNYYGANPARGTFNTVDFYVEGDFSTGFSGFAAGIEDPNPLPISYLKFEAAWQGSDALLDWEIAVLDDQAAYFEILRKDLEGNFNAIGQVLAGQKQSSFRYLDPDPAGSGLESLFYQIRTVDRNGNSVLSEVRELRIANGFDLEVFPNPFSQQFTLRIDLEEAQDLKIELVDVMGKQILSRKVQGQTGQNEWQWSPRQLAPGIYFLKISGQDQNNIVKLIRY